MGVLLLTNSLVSYVETRGDGNRRGRASLRRPSRIISTSVESFWPRDWVQRYQFKGCGAFEALNSCVLDP